MNLDILIRLFVKYQARTSFLKGSEFLMPPDDALKLVDELKSLGVLIMGSSGWYDVDRERNWIGEALEDDFLCWRYNPARRG
ncbi:MAG: hypothetical protein U0694_23725 [Anaerolineae bacterium]